MPFAKAKVTADILFLGSLILQFTRRHNIPNILLSWCVYSCWLWCLDSELENYLHDCRCHGRGNCSFNDTAVSIFLHHTRVITPKRVTGGGAHLRGLAPGQHISEERPQRWRAVWPHCVQFDLPEIRTTNLPPREQYLSVFFY